MPFRGARIGTTRYQCDRFGYSLQTARLPGGHWNSAHDAVKHTLQDIARAMGVQSTAEVMNLFSPHLPQEAQAQFQSAGSTRVGYVPDLLMHLQPPVLGEVKGVRPCKSRYWPPAQAAASFDEHAYAVNRREALVNTELLNRADKLDQEFNGTPVGTVGPLGAAFRRDSATANGANVSVRSPFAPGAAAGVVGPTEPLVREHRLGLTVCGWEIRELACETFETFEVASGGVKGKNLQTNFPFLCW